MVSDKRVNATGSIPPAARPMMKHMTRLSVKLGMAPQMAVATKMTPANSIAALRPIRSPSQPHRSEPRTVPVRPNSGSNAAGG